MPKFEFYNFESISSTNDKAREFAGKGQYNLVVTAKKQETGRGRFGREWSSEPGGLYMTMLLKEKHIDKVKYLTFIASIAVAKSIIDFCNLKAKVKWPNDVLVNDKKVCGILTETISGKENYALVGIGVNVNNNKFPASIKNKATSLKLETNKTYSLEMLSKKIIKHFSSLHSFYENENYEKIIELWKTYSHTLGKRIKAKTLNGDFAGKAIDIDDECNLVLRLDDRSVKKIIEADIFVVLA
ncbi:MAG: biotin--[acetyl-CoA-carboxylase] ligase [Nanoarchaeota archaeon]